MGEQAPQRIKDSPKLVLLRVSQQNFHIYFIPLILEGEKRESNEEVNLLKRNFVLF